MANKPDNKKILDGREFGDYPLNYVQQYETGRMIATTITKENPMFQEHNPTPEGNFTSLQHSQGHMTESVDSSRNDSQDTMTSTTGKNVDSGTGGGNRGNQGQGTYREDGGGTYTTGAGPNINNSAGNITNLGALQNASLHQGFLGHCATYLKNGSYDFRSDQHAAITASYTFHVAAENEISLRAKDGNIGLTTDKNITNDANGNFVGNAKGKYRTKGSEQNYVTSDTETVVSVGGSAGIVIGKDKITLKVGGAGIEITDGKITIVSGGGGSLMIDSKLTLNAETHTGTWLYAKTAETIGTAPNVGSSGSVSGNIPSDPAPKDNTGQGENNYAADPHPDYRIA